MSAGRKASRTRVWPVLRLGIEFPDYPPTGTGPKLRRQEEVIPGTVTRAHTRTARERSLVLSRRGLLLRRLRQLFRPARDRHWTSSSSSSSSAASSVPAPPPARVASRCP